MQYDNHQDASSTAFARQAVAPVVAVGVCQEVVGSSRVGRGNDA
jgi:hypothetical protein